MQNKLPHTLSVKSALKEYHSKESGLKSDEAQQRLLKNGKNVLTDTKKHGKLYKYFSQYKDVMIIILLVAAVINLVVTIVGGANEGYIDVGIILGIVVLNTIIGYIQEDKAEKAIESLRQMSEPFSKVFRDGEIKRIPTKELVVGDVLLLEAGDIVGADCLIIETKGLSCDESSLTGESKAVSKAVCKGLPEKTPLGERTNMVFSGSNVTFGRAIALVVAVGMDTELGHIASMLEQGKPETTPIQKKLNKLGKVLSIMVIVIAVMIFVINVFVRSSHNILDALLTTIAIAVAAIPESLPAVVTIVMATGVSRMAKRKAVIRKLHAVETLGSCEVICTDKTGTLTLNKMTVKSFYVDGHIIDEDKFDIENHKEFLNGMVLCNDAFENADGFVGDPTEIGLLEFAKKHEIKKSSFEKLFSRVHEIPFDSTRKVMTTFNEVDGRVIAYTKGAPDVILKHVDKILIDNKIFELDKTQKRRYLNALQKMSEKGLRTLALCYRVHRGKKELGEADEQDMVILGIVAMQDPPRLEARMSVEECHKAGIKTVMISGDYEAVAREIATEVGIYHEGDRIVTGAELDSMTDDDLVKILEEVVVYARVTPKDKLRIVNAWKRLGKTVAMTGDGVNDAPSIKEADIGVGMGITGTEVTKQVADMVLMDDNFSTIVGAVEEGRRIYNNIQKVVAFLIGSNLVEVFAILLCTLIFPELVCFTAIQILVINLITDALPAIALSVERAEKDVMQKRPRSKKEGIFGSMWPMMIVQCIWQTICIVLTFAITFKLTNDNALATTMAFVVLSFTELFYIANIRSFHSIFTQNPFYNKWFWITMVISVLINVVLVVVPAVSGVFDLTALSLAQWGIACAVALSIIPVIELFKLVRFFITKRNKK